MILPASGEISSAKSEYVIGRFTHAWRIKIAKAWRARSLLWIG